MTYRKYSWFGLVLVCAGLAGMQVVLGEDAEDGGMSVEALAAFHAPTHVRVLPDVVAEDPGGYTFTAADGPANRIMNINFEPFNFRTKFHAEGDSPNEIVLPDSQISKYDSIGSGYWDGATVRVYRVVNGKLVKVRTDKVRETIVEQWNGVAGISSSELVQPDTTDAEVWIDSWSRRGVERYYVITAVDKDGRESKISNSAKVFYPLEKPKKVEKSSLKANKLIRFNVPREIKDGEVPVAPSELTAGYNAITDRVELKWTASPTADIVGYRVKAADVNPSRMRGNHIYLEDSPKDSKLYIRKGDMIFVDKQIRKWDKEKMFSNRVYDLGRSYPDIYFQPTETRRWELVEHPAPVPPELAQSGKTCVRIDIDGDETINLKKYCYSGISQNWYKVLDPEKTYVVEFWAKQSNMADPKITFSMPGPFRHENAIVPVVSQIDENWQLYSFEIKVKKKLETRGVGQVALSFNGPGTLWLDNWRFYEKGTDFMDFPASEIEELQKSGMAAYRSHAHIKTGEGAYTMEGFTNPTAGIGWRGYRPNSQHTLPSLLSIMKRANINPWLQIEMVMTEDEWLGFVEYFCATYDPKKDSPKTKPWAFKRYEQGHPEPYLDDFDRVLFEISNETWNPMFYPFCFLYNTMTDEVTGENYSGGAIYGMLQEYVIDIFHSSPYWSKEADEKFEFVLGGWAIKTGEGGYTVQAAKHSPSSQHITIASYNGGWDENAPPAKAAPKGYFDALSTSKRSSQARALLLSDALAKNDVHASLGTYEAGPGYNLNGLNGVSMSKEQVEQESRTMKSLAAGTATLDVFLTQGSLGYHLQNFFTFQRNRNYWTSHARIENGGQAYPSWKLLSLYNREGKGDFLLAQTLEGATYTFEKNAKRAGLKNMPLVGVYATRQDDRLNLFVISRKAREYPVTGDKGYSQVSIDLPVKSAKELKLFRMTGDPGEHNLDADNVRIDEISLDSKLAKSIFKVDEQSGADKDGLPPASTFLYVFSGVKWNSSTQTIMVSPAPGQPRAASEGPITFRVSYPAAPENDPPNGCVVSGTSGADKIVNVTTVPATDGTCFDVTVDGMVKNGTVVLTVGKYTATVDFAVPTGVELRLAALDFPDGSQSPTTKHKGKVIPFTFVSPVIQPTDLVDSPEQLFDDNGYYNDDGVGDWNYNFAEVNTNAYYGFTIAPSFERTIALTKLKVGIFSFSPELKAELRYSIDDFVTCKSLGMTPKGKYKSGLMHNVGEPVTIDLSGEEVLQNLDKPVKFRIYLFGLKEKTVAGIGKLGKDKDDIIIEGMLVK
jgi:hypothetical protein